MSVRVFADWLGVDARTVSKWERAGITLRVRPATAEILDRALEQLGAGARARFEHAITMEDEQPVNRRDLLRAGIAAPLLGVAAVPLPPPTRGVDPLMIDHIEAVLDVAKRQDDALGASAAIDTVLGQTRVAAALLNHCPPGLLPRLTGVYSDLLGFAGCLRFDLGDFAAAGKLYDAAREAAHDADADELSVYMLCHLAQLAVWRGAPRVAVDHAVAATSWARSIGDRLLQEYALQRAAVAFAAAAQRSDAFVALEKAATVLDKAESGTASLAYFNGSGLLTSMRTEVMLRVGDAGAAQAPAQEALDMFDRSMVRDRAFALLDLAAVDTALGRVESAAGSVGESARLAACNRSRRLAGAIVAARVDLEPWADSRAVVTLDEELAEVLA